MEVEGDFKMDYFLDIYDINNIYFNKINYITL